MGIDVNNSRRDHPDRNIWYKAKYVSNNKLVKDAVPQGVFYSRDVKDFGTQLAQVGNGQVILKTGEIETNDNVSEMEVNDFVLYDGTLYRVDNVVHGDLNKNKFISTRPSYTSIISLIGR
jgi:hypothetical protein